MSVITNLKRIFDILRVYNRYDYRIIRTVESLYFP